MTTGFGGKRIVDWLSGEQLPGSVEICVFSSLPIVLTAWRSVCTVSLVPWGIKLVLSLILQMMLPRPSLYLSPELIVAPFLKRAIPESIWSKHVCLIVHPGIVW